MPRAYGSWGLDYVKQRGLWRVRPPRSVDPKRRPTYHRTRAEAEAYVASEQARASRAAGVHADDMTLGDYLAWWVEMMRVPRRWSADTVRLYEAQIRRLGSDLLGMPIRLVTKALVQARVNELLTVGVRAYRRPPHQRGISADSVIGTVRTWRVALAEAVDEHGLLDANPATKLILPEPDRDDADVWTREEVLALVKALPGTRCEMLLSLAIAGGFRIGEVLAFRWSDVDWRESRIWAHATGTRGVQEQTKTRRRRWVPLPPAVMELLKLHRASQTWSAEFICERLPGRRWSYTGVRKNLRSICQEIGISDYGTHAARHHAASMMQERGMSLAALARVLGNSPGTLAKRYLHPSPEAIRQAAEITGELFSQREETGSQEAGSA